MKILFLCLLLMQQNLVTELHRMKDGSQALKITVGFNFNEIRACGNKFKNNCIKRLEYVRLTNNKEIVEAVINVPPDSQEYKPTLQSFYVKIDVTKTQEVFVLRSIRIDSTDKQHIVLEGRWVVRPRVNRI